MCRRLYWIELRHSVFNCVVTRLTLFVFSYSHFIEIKQSLSDEVANSNNQFSQVETKIADIKKSLPNLPGKWSDGSYCILANGGCPAGFARYEGHLKALRIYRCNTAYLREVFFGDSKLSKHGCSNENDLAWSEVHIQACCK